MYLFLAIITNAVIKFRLETGNAKSSANSDFRKPFNFSRYQFVLVTLYHVLFPKLFAGVSHIRD